MAIFGCIEGRYEVQDVPFGKVYGWRPERVVVECGCGETPTLTRSESACLWCEADHAPAVREGLAGLGRPPKDGSAHLWRQEAATGDRERDAGMPYCCQRFPEPSRSPHFSARRPAEAATPSFVEPSPTSRRASVVGPGNLPRPFFLPLFIEMRA